MNAFDLVLLVLTGVLALGGALWGIGRMVISLLGFLVAFFLGLRMAERGPAWLGGVINSPEWARLTAFFVVFVGIMLVAAGAAYLMRHFLRTVLLGLPDRIAGAVAGVLVAVMIGAAMTVPLTALPPQEEPILHDSLLAPYSLYAADFMRYLIPTEVERQYRVKSLALRLAWEESTRRREHGSKR